MEVSKHTSSELKGGSRSVTEKTEAKCKCKHGDWTSSWGFYNDKFTADLSGTPIDCKDYPQTVGLKSERKPKTNEWKLKLLYDVSTPDFSGVTFFENLEVEHNNKAEWIVRSKTNVQYETEYSVGAHVEHDTKDFTKIRGQAVCSPKDCDSTFWLRGDLKREFVGTGCDNKLKEGIFHSWEGLYCWTEGFKGVMGYPVKLLGGVHYDLGTTSKLTAHGEVGENYMFRSGATHNVDKNWTVGINQRFDSARIGKKDVDPYDFGFSLTYKL